MYRHIDFARWSTFAEPLQIYEYKYLIQLFLIELLIVIEYRCDGMRMRDK